MILSAFEWWNPADFYWQWVNLSAGLLGLVAGIFSWFQSSKAARNAMAAEIAAQDAREATLKLVRHDRLIELVREFEELHHLMHSPDLLTQKCTRMRGTIVSFKREAAGELDSGSLENLDQVREHLTAIIEPAYNPRKLSKENRSMRLAAAIAQMTEDLSSVQAKLGIQLSENT